jgi:UrcA family protein
MKHATLGISIAMTAMLTPTPVPAADRETDPDAFRVGIPVSDLDLQTRHGRELLRKRIRQTARRTCAMITSTSAYDQATYVQCLSQFDHAFAHADPAELARSSATVGKLSSPAR